jgi:hypothetical protein
LRSYADVQKDFYSAFQDLARQCEGFLGHSQTLRSWFRLVVYRYGLTNLDLDLSAFKILIHTELSFSKDVELAPKFVEFLASLKRIDSLEKELEALQAQGVKPEVLTVTA